MKENGSFMQSLRIQAESMKCELSVKMDCVGDIVAFEGHQICTDLSLDVLDDLLKEFVTRAMQKVDDVIDTVKKSIGVGGIFVISKILLVGGSSRLVCIGRELFNRYGVEASNDMDPDTSVAMGAADLAASLFHKDHVLVKDVAPLGLGVGVNGGFVDRVIQPNTTLPVSTTKHYCNHAANQQFIRVVVYEGDRMGISDCKPLTQFNLKIDKCGAGEYLIAVTFTLDVSGK